jgi:hypothetical protein
MLLERKRNCKTRRHRLDGQQTSFAELVFSGGAGRRKSSKNLCVIKKAD